MFIGGLTEFVRYTTFYLLVEYNPTGEFDEYGEDEVRSTWHLLGSYSTPARALCGRVMGQDEGSDWELWPEANTDFITQEGAGCPLCKERLLEHGAAVSPPNPPNWQEAGDRLATRSWITPAPYAERNGAATVGVAAAGRVYLHPGQRTQWDSLTSDQQRQAGRTSNRLFRREHRQPAGRRPILHISRATPGGDPIFVID